MRFERVRRDRGKNHLDVVCVNFSLKDSNKHSHVYNILGGSDEQHEIILRDVKMHHLNTDVFSNTSVKCDTVNRRKEEN